jgi:hypothetical protein
MQDSVCCSSVVLLDTWSRHDWDGGLQLESVSELELLSVQTRNSTYEIAVVSSQTGEVLVRGGRYFPEFQAARLTGSSLGGSFLKVRGIYVGFNVELQVGARSIITSPVRSISRLPSVTC